MSLNFDEIGKMIATIGKKTVYLNDKPVEDGVDSMKAKNDNVFQHIPDKKTERSVLYITGQSGSGKSFYTKNYIEQYHKMFPKREVFVFSSLESDTTLDKLKILKRIKIKQESFLNSELTAEDFKDSLCIFDDCDVISNKTIKHKVFSILNSILETGRHFNTSVIFTSHNATMGVDTKRILNECHSITIFPRNIGGKTAKYLLDQYLGLDKNQIMKIKKCEGRWCTIMKSYPIVILTENEIYTL